MAKLVLVGGGFSDILGNPVANGKLILKLSEDSQIAGIIGQVGASIKISIPLDSSGDVVGSPAVSVWPNDQLISSEPSFYRAWVYAENGQLAWGGRSGSQQTITGTSPFNLDSWAAVENQ